MDPITIRLAEELEWNKQQVADIIALIDEGNTIPFIARYRKEKTGGMDDQTLRRLADRLAYLRTLEERRAEILRLIGEQDKLTAKLEADIQTAQTMQALEDLYRPFRPKRRTRASIAREKGLEPLARLLMAQQAAGEELTAAADALLSPDKGVQSREEALAGAMDILAEEISDDAEIRGKIRDMTAANGVFSAAAAKTQEDSVYRQYEDYGEPVKKAANHRILAVNRGEKEGFLKAGISVEEEPILQFLDRKLLKNPPSAGTEYVRLAAHDAYRRLIAPSVENELRAQLTDRAGEAAIHLFAANLSGLLMQPPVRGKVVLGLDPAYRTGCKLAVVDETGRVLATDIVYCTLEHHDKAKAKQKVLDLIARYNIDLVAIGNGTATKESEIFVTDVIRSASREVKYMVVNEAGASVYSASKLGAEEFPDYDVALRSAVSIARRLQDPLAELVKIEPRAIGVGQYQHDMNQKRLDEALSGVVEDCVNSVGVDLNTASAPLLSHVAGIHAQVAKNIVRYREEHGRFRSRRELLKVPKLGEKAFLQCAGFMRIPEAEEPLDNTAVHPESYPAARDVLKKMGFTAKAAAGSSDFHKAAAHADIARLANELGVGEPTLRDILEAVEKPGRDPRDELPKPELRSELLSIENLQEGMVLSGTVRNVTDFGAFVDIGVHQDGLVHISQICEKYIKHPMDVLSVGDVVQVKIIGLDIPRKRISLSIKQA